MIDTLFFDVGGVLLTNGWDRRSRARAAEHFKLDYDDFQDRHELVLADFETGRLPLDGYLQRTVFYRDRPFSRDEFRQFMLDQSQALPGALELAGALADTGRYLLATLNNESLELNEYRISRFELTRAFTSFFSSCFLGARKPAERIYRLALQLTQRDPARCVFIDDREVNLEAARGLGLHTIHNEGAESLRERLAELGVVA